MKKLCKVVYERAYKKQAVSTYLWRGKVIRNLVKNMSFCGCVKESDKPVQC